MSRRAGEIWSGGLCLAAGGIHGALTPAHLEEWWGYGLFFAGAAAAQVLLGLALTLQAFDDEPSRRAMYLGGIVGNSLIVALYVVTRTLGVPFAGPARGEIEPFDALGLGTGAMEISAVLVFLWLLRGQRREPHARKDEGRRKPEPRAERLSERENAA